MNELRFDNRVVVVTGAGAGLGRAYALLFAARGANVVVNDLGVGRHGDGSSSKAADEVVNEIKRQGGNAVADYNSVVEGENIIKTALDSFGRVDVLVNNAGILRDKSFARISERDWDLIHDVHLKGSFKTTQAAWPIFKKQNYGRVIMTSSNSGLYGNFGQANYSAAKMGLVGLCNTVAIEGGRSNIHCNVIVPTAASRLTEDILPPDIYAQLKPEYIAPVVAYLCHESCEENGSVIESAIGWVGKCEVVRGKGRQLRSTSGAGVSLEAVRDSWDRVTDMRGARNAGTIQAVTAELVGSLEAGDGGDEDDEELHSFAFDERDLMLYALGVGASSHAAGELKYVYENDESFCALPTYYVIPAIVAAMSGEAITGALPGGVELASVLHGEHYLELCDGGSPPPLSGTLVSRCAVQEVLDKGSGAAVVVRVETSARADGRPVAVNQLVAFAVGAGAWGGERAARHAVPCREPPSREPDALAEWCVPVDQAALYRLSGDRNPVHVDPQVAALAGFPRPILHGLCTLGASVRLALQRYAPAQLHAVKARFSATVYPGQTLRVAMWRDGERIYFRTTVLETDKVAISGAYIDLKSSKMQPTIRGVSAGAALKSDAIFEGIAERVRSEPAKAKAVNAVFLYNITKNGKQIKQWTMDLKNAKIYEGGPNECKPNTTLTVSDEDFVDMALGKLNPQAAFMKGKLKVAGNIMMAQKLTPLLKTGAKL